jgi:hypothetical protein
MIKLGSVPLEARLLAIKSAARQGSPASWLLHKQRMHAAATQYAAWLVNANLESRP